MGGTGATAGAAFSAGAELNWMRASGEQGDHENFQDALRLAGAAAAQPPAPKNAAAAAAAAADDDDVTFESPRMVPIDVPKPVARFGCRGA